MKRLIVTSCLFLALSLTTQAQIFKLGLKGGVNYANQNGTAITVNNKNYKTEAITNYHIGLLAEVNLGKRFSIQPEILYSKQGSTYTGNIPGFFRTKLDYISLPVEGKFKITEKISFEAGPQLGILMSSRLKTNNSNLKIEGLKTLDFAINAGLQYNINKGAFVQGRYVFGLTDTGLSGNSNNRNTNSVIQLSIGYLF